MSVIIEKTFLDKFNVHNIAVYNAERKPNVHLTQRAEL